MTRHAYVFLYDDRVGTREEVKDYIDRLPEVLNWRFDLPNSFYIVSQCSADELAEKIQEFTDGNGRFLVLEVTGNKQGWLPRRTWNMINKKMCPNEQ